MDRMVTEPKYLLIMACSQRKRPDPGLLPAIERDTGPQFQVLRKFLREYSHKPNVLSVYILSAKFGLIPATQPIPDYDYKITPKRANELQRQILSQLKSLWHNESYTELFIDLGKTYLQTLTDYEQAKPANIQIVVAQGSQGRRQAELRNWLYHVSAEQMAGDQVRINQQDKAILRGIEINLTLEQVIEIARQTLAKGNDHSTSYQSTYVLVDDQRIAPKWLVSQLTGLPVGAFHTDEAKRVLQQLGVEVRHI